MIKKFLFFSFQLLENVRESVKRIRATANSQLKTINSRAGFTLIETLVSITVLVIAVAGPMTLAAQSLASAFYARDQVTAFHMAQEAIEVIRAVRDGNALRILTLGTQIDLLDGIPSTTGQPFTVDTITQIMSVCGSGTCPVLRNNGELYGYGTGGDWTDTRYTRTVRVVVVDANEDEVRVSVEVRWRSGVYAERSFTISENMYRWVSAE